LVTTQLNDFIVNLLKSLKNYLVIESLILQNEFLFTKREKRIF